MNAEEARKQSALNKILVEKELIDALFKNIAEYIKIAVKSGKNLTHVGFTCSLSDDVISIVKASLEADGFNVVRSMGDFTISW